jgi:hypothetical protein
LEQQFLALSEAEMQHIKFLSPKGKFLIRSGASFWIAEKRFWAAGSNFSRALGFELSFDFLYGL